MQIDIKITEILSRTIRVNALSIEDAIIIVNNMYRNEDIVLDSSDFDGNVIIEKEEDNYNTKQQWT